ncbi:hypothetical protein RCC89_11100 [Cytophagaceae bacterium ABcell3]|nr:hypothetical protein RCC89_11100 [Cytophagaceae bacterium ABcell3]
MKTLSLGVNNWSKLVVFSFVSLLVNTSLAVSIEGKKLSLMSDLVKLYLYTFFAGALLYGCIALLTGFVFGLFPHVGLTYKQRVVRAALISFITVTSALSAIYIYHFFS